MSEFRMDALDRGGSTRGKASRRRILQGMSGGAAAVLGGLAARGTATPVAMLEPAGDDSPESTAAADAPIEQIKATPAWERTAVILTYDDFGGWYDHVAPPRIDRWGPGGRAPAPIVSPHARRGFVDHTPYDHTSILAFIAWRFDLAPLTSRDANACNLLAAFDFAASG